MATVIAATSYGGPEALSVLQRDVPAPAPGEVTVEVRAAGVNPIDYKVYSGAMGDSPDALPMRLGLEIAGVVTSVGPEAAGPAGALAVGDEVIAYRVQGGYATELTVPADVVVPKPPELSWEEAAGILLTGSTAVHALAAARVRAGETLLIHGGSGGVGLLVVQLAVAAGATVLATAGEQRAELLRGHRAVPLAYGPGLAERVRAAAPSGVHAVIDAVGTDEAVDVSLQLVPDRSRIVSMAAFGRADTGITLIGGGPGADPGEKIRAQAWRQLLPLAAQGRLTVQISRVYPLVEAAAAHRFLAQGHAGGKVILRP